MAEIKSTIDLIMERTKGLTLSSEEKERLDEEKRVRGAQGLVQRYLRGDLSLDELSRQMEEGSSNSRKAMMQALVEGMRLGREEFSRGLEALERWRGKENRFQLQRIRDLSHQFGQALQKRRRKVKAELWEDLARRGVQGSAVEPNVEGSGRWDETINQVEREFEPRLGELRKELLAHL
jgi:hypothetical protein